jgi:hypothetical protein
MSDYSEEVCWGERRTLVEVAGMNGISHTPGPGV